MELQSIKDRIPDYAKDLRLNLDAVLSRSSLTPAQAQAALTAAALMGMNNVWYPYVEMAADPDLKTVRPELRMNAYATHGGVDRTSFELYALAASIVGKCEFCVQSHYKLLRENGFSTQQLRDVGRIAAVVNAVAQVLAIEHARAAEGVAA